MIKTKKDSLLELLARIRTHKALDRAVKKDSYYRFTLKEQDKAYNELYKANLRKEQKCIVDRALSTLNANGAAYGLCQKRITSNPKLNNCVSEKGIFNQ